MNKLIYVVAIIAVVGIGGMFAGCLTEESLVSRSDQIRIIGDNQKAILFNQDKILNWETSRNGQVNNKLDAIIDGQRKQADYTQMLISEVRKSNQTNSNIIKIDISIDRGGYGEVASFSNVDEAINFIRALK